MKKIILIGVLVISGLSFGRDFEVREENDLEHVMNYTKISQEMSSREVNLSNENIEKYSEYHWELMNMDRGHEDR